MEREQKISLLVDAILRGEVFDLRSQPVGGGEWSLEVLSVNMADETEYLFELVGSNGTHPDYPADDLRGEFESLLNEAEDKVAAMV